MIKPAILFAVCCLLACNTPEAKFRRLQHAFREQYARQDFFEIHLKSEVLHLPLPTGADTSGQRKGLAKNLLEEANSIEDVQLSANDRGQLIQLRAALQDDVAREGTTFFDPSRYVVLRYLQQYSGHSELPIFLEKIPAYYAHIEERWQSPEARFVPKAVLESQETLDFLNGLEEKSSGKNLAISRAAKAAVKDFIGLCQSALLQ